MCLHELHVHSEAHGGQKRIPHSLELNYRELWATNTAAVNPTLVLWEGRKSSSALSHSLSHKLA